MAGVYTDQRLNLSKLGKAFGKMCIRDSPCNDHDTAADPAENSLVASVLQEIPNAGKHETLRNMITIAMS